MIFTERQKKQALKNFNIKHISPSTLDISQLKNRHLKPPKLRNLTEQQKQYHEHIQDLKYEVNLRNKYESVNKYNSKEKLSMFNVIDNKFNMWGDVEDTV